MPAVVSIVKKPSVASPLHGFQELISVIFIRAPCILCLHAAWPVFAWLFIQALVPAIRKYCGKLCILCMRMELYTFVWNNEEACCFLMVVNIGHAESKASNCLGSCISWEFWSYQFLRIPIRNYEIVTRIGANFCLTEVLAAMTGLSFESSVSVGPPWRRFQL